MALLNNIPILVTEEDFKEDNEITQHPVEKGLPLTDTSISNPKTLSLSGSIANTNKMTAKDIVDKIRALRQSGSLVKYVGRTTIGNMQIKSFNPKYTNKNWGGADFDMELIEVRIAKSSYNPKTPAATTTTKKNNPVLKVGSIVVFKGGNVYVSSDAKKPAAKRGRSTCKITIISTASWSIHQYHLISTDGKMVYGWVDKANIEGTGNSGTAKKSNGGTQQVNSKNKAVYHTVKKGETVWGLVNNQYKSLGKSCQWVIDNNPKAFSRKGDARTLQIGAKLLMGYK